jgi:hypothetical protein
MAVQGLVICLDTRAASQSSNDSTISFMNNDYRSRSNDSNNLVRFQSLSLSKNPGSLSTL